VINNTRQCNSVDKNHSVLGNLNRQIVDGAQIMNWSSQLAVSAQAQWKFCQNRQKCCQITTIFILLLEIDITENDGDSRYRNESGNTSISAVRVHNNKMV